MPVSHSYDVRGLFDRRQGGLCSAEDLRSFINTIDSDNSTRKVICGVIRRTVLRRDWKLYQGILGKDYGSTKQGSYLLDTSYCLFIFVSRGVPLKTGQSAAMLRRRTKLRLEVDEAVFFTCLFDMPGPIDRAKGLTFSLQQTAPSKLRPTDSRIQPFVIEL